MLEILKIDIKKIFIIILISMPFGYYLYSKEIQKINFKIEFHGGEVVAENFCESYSSKVDIVVSDLRVNDSISQMISGKYVEYPNISSSGKLNYDDRVKKYEIIYKAKYSELENLKKLSKNIINAIEKAENKFYYKNLSDIRLHCRNGTYRAFKYIPLDRESIKYFTSQRRSDLNAYFILFSPLLILTSLLVIYNRVRIIFKNDNNLNI